MKEIDYKICETKKSLKALKKEKNMIKLLIIKEREKKKADSEIEETFFSRISSLKLTSQKSRTSLDKFGSSITTISPRSPKSKTIIEENCGVTCEESHFSFHKGYSKSLTFPDKLSDLKITTYPRIDSYENVSPDFKRTSLFEDTKMKSQVKKETSRQNNLNDSLYEEINQQMTNYKNPNVINKADLSFFGQESPRKKPKQNQEEQREFELLKYSKDKLKGNSSQANNPNNSFIQSNKQNEKTKNSEINQIQLYSLTEKLKNRF